MDELQTVLAKAEGNLRSQLLIGLFTGLRLADVIILRVGNIEHNLYPPDTGPRPGFIVIKPNKTEHLNKVVEVPIHSSLAKLSRELTAGRNEEFLFPDKQSLHANDASDLTSTVQAFFESCGIETTEHLENGQRRRDIVRVGFDPLLMTVLVDLCPVVSNSSVEPPKGELSCSRLQ